MASILITGASAGIGRATALELTQRGHEVWGTARRLERLPVMARFHPLKLDLSIPDLLSRAVRGACAESGGFDVLINNAGEAVFAALEDVAQSSLEDQFQTLVFAPVAIARELLPELRARRGLIVNVSSLAARLPIPFMAPYSAAKAALAALSWSLQLELEPHGVRVVDVQPGDIDTTFHHAMLHPDLAPASAYAPAMRKVLDLNERSMLKGPGPELVARAIADIVEHRRQRRSPLVLGTVFQSRVVPLALRLFPAPLMRYCVKRYYRL
ncbi:MAG: SDR family NAD(P)-dependent oxidoreductase [Gammaproteobacteria bacterium]